jgi:hypothetical protein
MFDAVAAAELSLSGLSSELNVVVLPGYHEFRPVERRLIEYLFDEFPIMEPLPSTRMVGAESTPLWRTSWMPTTHLTLRQ